MFCPWVCLEGHWLEIDDVTPLGKCRICLTPVRCKTRPEEVREAMKKDSFSPRRLVKVHGRWYREIQAECAYCVKLYKTIYRNSKYCSDKCRAKVLEEKEERRIGSIRCRFCGIIVQTFDKRVRFCEDECRLIHRNL